MQVMKLSKNSCNFTSFKLSFRFVVRKKGKRKKKKKKKGPFRREKWKPKKQRKTEEKKKPRLSLSLSLATFKLSSQMRELWDWELRNDTVCLAKRWLRSSSNSSRRWDPSSKLFLLPKTLSSSSWRFAFLWNFRSLLSPRVFPSPIPKFVIFSAGNFSLGCVCVSYFGYVLFGCREKKEKLCELRRMARLRN